MSHINTPSDFIVLVSSEEDYHAGFHQFADKVNRKLKAGYQLHGQPLCINKCLCQAMVRFDDPSHAGGTAAGHKH